LFSNGPTTIFSMRTSSPVVRQQVMTMDAGYPGFSESRRHPGDDLLQ
jgi:hypothetical protein